MAFASHGTTESHVRKSQFNLTQCTLIPSQVYANAPLKTFVQTPLVYGEAFVYTSSVAVFRQVFGLNSVFEKDPASTGNSDIWWVSKLHFVASLQNDMTLSMKSFRAERYWSGGR